MTWQNQIEHNPDILDGKSIIKGTRIAVEQILDHLAGGWSFTEIRANYPGVTDDGIRAC
jgi:uncharacterized protein (DUF433 family)